MSRGVKDVLKERGISFEENVCTATLSTFRIGGRASLLITPLCQNEFLEALRICRDFHYPYAVIGKGSNVLFADQDFKMALVCTKNLNTVRFFEGDAIVDCGVSLSAFSALCARRGFADCAALSGIPGTLGGALFMNAGAHGKEISQLVESVTVYSPCEGKIKTYFAKELNYSYRNSRFQTENEVILRAYLALKSREEPDKIFEKIRDLNQKRRRTQPLDLPSAGSVFRRPSPDMPIGKIIDELGLKGYAIGGAAVSEKHAGFIVNRGGASAGDVKELIRFLQDKIEKERGVRPQTEVRFIPTEL